jgi:hypothetical protein
MRNSCLIVLAVCSGLLGACGFGGDSAAPSRAATVDTVNPNESALRAACGDDAQPETALQGQVPRADRQSGRSAEGYWCNLERVGQFQGEGASWQHAWYDDCAYYDTANRDTQANLGSVVVDVADPQAPVASAYLDTIAMLDPWESLKVNEKRGMLAAVNGTGGGGGPEFSVYDVTSNCAQPRLIAEAIFEGNAGHEGNWAPDGLTYYGSNGGNGYAIDMSDAAAPTLIAQFTGTGHGLSFSDDGTRGYFVSLAPPGLSIVDTSEIQRRAPGARTREIGATYWGDGAIAQHTIPVTIKGKPYIVFVDEGGFGAARIIDITDERNPVVISKLKLEIHLPENRGQATADGAAGVIQYDGHYCSVDKPVDPTVLGCGYAWSGIRVFDIRDPYLPREIAYYVPPAVAPPAGAQQGSAEVDTCTAQVRFIPERAEVWTTCHANGFLVLRFTNGVWPFKD